MSLSPADLLAPIGPIEPSLFPGEDSIALTARVQAYVESAYADSRIVAVGDADEVHEALQDRMAQAFALHKAFSSAYIRMSAQPVSLDVGGIKTGFSAEQIRNLKALAENYWDDFLALVPAPVAPVAVPTGTRSIVTKARW